MKSMFRFSLILLTPVLIAISLKVLATQANAKSALSPTRMLSSLSVRQEVSSGYTRSKFRHWIDNDKDSCDTRSEVLILESKVAAKIGKSCSLKSGKWISKYDNIQVANATELDIDHFVPLNEAWQSGAFDWNADTRTSYANDLGYAVSLIAVTAHSNRSKGDKDPNRWMPSYKNYRCEYIANWIAVKYRWSLSIDSVERDFLVSEINKCGSKAAVSAPKRATIVRTAADTVQTQTPSPSLSQDSESDPRYSTCTAAKSAGYGPYRIGINPEYYWYADKDADGIVCE